MQNKLKKLYEMSMTIAGDPVEVFRHIAKIIAELYELNIVCLSKVNKNYLEFLVIYDNGEITTNAGICPLSTTPCATVEATKDVRIYSRVTEHFPEASFLKHHNAFSYCGFPSLDHDGNVKVVTCLLDNKPRTFDEDDIEILRIFGQRIGMEVERHEHLMAAKEAQNHLNYVAHHDFLTGLPNRVLLEERFKLALAQAKRKESSVALMMLDLDRFKEINDSQGHHIGDLLIKKVAERLKNAIRDIDTLSRQGGDEFLVILTNIRHTEDVISIAEKILSLLNKAFLIEDNFFTATASIGIALFPKDGNDLNQLQKHADTAMYQAKENGGNCIRFFRTEMALAAQQRQRLESHIRQAWINREFTLYYQPQIDIVTGNIVGCEALIRWHSASGVIAPNQFIPIAEKTGLILDIDAWVINEACQQAKRWQITNQALVVAINISALHLKQKNLVSLITDALTRYQLRPNLLEIELTETMLIQDIDAVRQTVSQLKKLGVKLSIDDFGTGYSNLSLLSKLNLDKIKIDQSFIKNMVDNYNDSIIVRATIDLAHNLGLIVLAEGVETNCIFEKLKVFNCDQLQGYHFGKPNPPEFIDPFIHKL